MKTIYCAQKELYSVKLELFLQITVYTADQDDDAQDDESYGLHAGQPIVSLTDPPFTRDCAFNENLSYKAINARNS
jgi:hypothetical protein